MVMVKRIVAARPFSSALLLCLVLACCNVVAGCAKRSSCFDPSKTPDEITRCLIAGGWITPAPTEVPTEPPVATVPPEATPDPTATEDPEPTATLPPSPAPGTPTPAQKPPVLKGINGGGGCMKGTEKFNGAFVSCLLDFTQIFHGSDGQDGPCDCGHFCDKASKYDCETRAAFCAAKTTMGDECSFRVWDEVRKINEGGFIVRLDGADLVPGSASSHQIRIRGQRGATVVVHVGPPDDLRSSEGIPISVRGENPFDRKGGGEKRWTLPTEPR